jgi:hypothetical protein
MTKVPSRIVPPAVEPARLLAELETLLTQLPTVEALSSTDDDALSWRGRALATVSAWNAVKGVQFDAHLAKIDDPFVLGDQLAAMKQIRALLHEARHSLLLEAGVGTSIAIDAGRPFQYFAELTGKIALAKADILFADPYLDAEFVARYLPQVSTGVAIRLLTRKCLAKLLPAVDMFVKESSAAVQVREIAFHDRHVFIDGSIGYQSGASFKDGAVKAPTGLLEIVDVLGPTLAAYENLWRQAKVHR